MATYKQAGVDKNIGYRTSSLARNLAQETNDKNILSQIGGFAAVYDISASRDSLLVASTDGVGTKVKLAELKKDYSTIGIDCVAMCVNDILCSGAKPLFFLDYLAASRFEFDTIRQILTGLKHGCDLAGCSLIGGETAEMPGVYLAGSYDLAGFTVGLVAKDKLIQVQNVKVGDHIIGLASSGVHSNGFSLVRALAPNYEERLAGQSLLDLLLTPTKIYTAPVLDLMQRFKLKACAHITGGGLIENLPRALPQGMQAIIQSKNWPRPSVFDFIQKQGVAQTEMWSTFNMGIGFVLVVAPEESTPILERLRQLECEAYSIGHVIEGSPSLEII